MTNDSNLSKSCNLPNAQVRESERDGNRQKEREGEGDRDRRVRRGGRATH